MDRFKARLMRLPVICGIAAFALAGGCAPLTTDTDRVNWLKLAELRIHIGHVHERQDRALEHIGRQKEMVRKLEDVAGVTGASVAIWDPPPDEQEDSSTEVLAIVELVPQEKPDAKPDDEEMRKRLVGVLSKALPTAEGAWAWSLTPSVDGQRVIVLKATLGED